MVFLIISYRSSNEATSYPEKLVFRKISVLLWGFYYLKPYSELFYQAALLEALTFVLHFLRVQWGKKCVI
jgi:hypothetical protein